MVLCIILSRSNWKYEVTSGLRCRSNKLSSGYSKMFKLRSCIIAPNSDYYCAIRLTLPFNSQKLISKSGPSQILLPLWNQQNHNWNSMGLEDECRFWEIRPWNHSALLATLRLVKLSVHRALVPSNLPSKWGGWLGDGVWGWQFPHVRLSKNMIGQKRIQKDPKRFKSSVSGRCLTPKRWSSTQRKWWQLHSLSLSLSCRDPFPSNVRTFFLQLVLFWSLQKMFVTSKSKVIWRRPGLLNLDVQPSHYPLPLTHMDNHGQA